MPKKEYEERADLVELLSSTTTTQVRSPAIKNELRKNLGDTYGWLRRSLACVATENSYERSP
ncbi:hypothetical protein [Nostoc sp.]|uniref:hypothetical protein n=1 Tax=Nostoc sp. TaxID=1180 RepID=UPI002FF56E39